MEKKIKAAQYKKKVALENIRSLERFMTAFSKDEVGQVPDALEGLQKHKEDFFAAMAKLEELDDSNEALESCITDRIDMEERCRRLKSFFRANLPKDAASDSSMLANSTMAFGRPNATNLRLPKIELPTFDGDSTKWLSFRDRFVSMIDDSAELPSIAKLQYLLSSLKGDAALPFEHTPLTNENYAVTWKALLKRYDNSRSLIREYWRRLHFLPAVKSESVESLTNLVDEFTRHVNGLVKLKEPVETWDTPLSNMLLMKFDSETILAWEKHSVHFERDRYQELMKFVEDRIQILKSTKRLIGDNDTPITVAGNSRPNASRKAITNTAATHRSSGPLQSRCLLECSENHPLRSCPVFHSKDVQHRREIVAKKHCCWNCLSNGHLAKDCKSDRSCRTCGERHHTLLHVASTISMGVNSEDETVFLETAVLHLIDDYGTMHEARALLDSGSMSNFISEAFARQLMASRSKVNVSISGIGMASQLVKGSIVATVQSKIQPFSSQMEFLILDTPSADIPTSHTDVSSWKMPADTRLADPTFYTPGKIDIVIGGDSFWELHSGKKRSLGKGRPWLVETPFGWVVAGNTSQVATEAPRICHVATSDIPLEAILSRFWECETLPNETVYSAEEDLCEKHYVSTTTRDATGRYVVALPFNSNAKIILGASKAIADRRLLGMERRLNSNPQMKEAYIKFMRDYESLGHMKKISEPVDDSVPHYYLPHHAVVKETSTTTKVRVVFDASCKTTSGFSLNDTLLVGPVVQQDLLSIVIRFRSHAIAITADVEKMYRQICHHADDKNFLRIRYRENSSEPIHTYELQTVTYGTASAPFLATRTLKQIANDHMEQYPRAVNPVLQDFYVDDLLTGTDSLTDAMEVVSQISAMLQSAGLSLKKWASNVPEVLSKMPPQDVAITPTFELRDAQTVSTLGLIWEPTVDLLRFRIELPTTAPMWTRRTTMSYIGKIFDPLGLLGPAITVAKLFLQQLWLLKQNGKAWDWDVELPSLLQKDWNKFYTKLHFLQEIRIPRYISLREATNFQLHIFADASQAAFGACCYLRAENRDGISVQLIAAKSKVVPLDNTHSIARLELCAARLATKLFRKVSQSLSIPIQSTICWTDSMTVLHWLNSSPRRWKPYVANRVALIQKEPGITCWRHVPGIDNPADDISRGLHPDKLLERVRWFHGPHWLSCNEESWPVPNSSMEEGECVSEERAVTPRVVAVSTTADFSNKLFASFSAYHRLRRSMAFCLRFIHCLTARGAAGIGVDGNRTEQLSIAERISRVAPLTRDELLQAETQLCRLSQEDCFAEELHIIKHGKEIPKTSKLRWLSPFVDSKGLLRVGGRLHNAQIQDATKHPILLSSKHSLAELLTVSYHLKLLHAGPQLLLATLRQRFWIIGGRNLAKAVFHHCQQCFKARPTLVKQSIADLPISRVTPTRPFAVSGVDYCGPVFIKSTIRNRSPTKAYIAIFVCFATRAVHIELVGDLTTASFLAALRRFVATRGNIAELHSDNATTFKGAAHELHRLYKMLKCNDQERDEIFNWCANHEIKWKFIPPRAPHFGGLWEAAVRSVKQHIIRTVGSTSLTQEGMVTLLAQVGQCLNSRPLVPLSDEPTDLEPLTPGHFLVGSNMFALPQVDRSQVPPNRLKEFEKVQGHVQTIWARWYPEYLQQLQARAKRCSPNPIQLEIGQLVLIKEDNVPPTMWPRGRITAVHPGKDKIVRVATIRTASGKEIVRAAARLALIPNPQVERANEL